MNTDVFNCTYVVGMAKSGTTTMAHLFGDTIKASHEPYGRELLTKILNRNSIDGAGDGIEEFVRNKERALNLDLNSSQFNFFILDTLLGLSPSCKFILTIRDCRPWLESFWNASINTPGEPWRSWRIFRFKPHRFSFQPHDELLKAKGLFPLASYLQFWRDHNQRVWQTVPKSRLLVVSTDQIFEQREIIAKFMGIEDTGLASTQIHNRTKMEHGILTRMDQSFVNDAIDKYVGNLMEILL